MRSLLKTRLLGIGVAVAVGLATSQASILAKVLNIPAEPSTAIGVPNTVQSSTALSAVIPTAMPTVAPSASGLAAYEGTLEQIYQQVNPSVVHIEVTSASTAGSGSGSGFVWDTQGHIVTNNHVVSGMDSINVVFSDGSMAAAKVVGADPDSDLAVIQVKVAAAQLQPVSLADSTQVKVGQFAIAIGSPFGERGTMTTGIISALGRSFPADSSNVQGPGYSLPDMIQTDAAINPGNSGGVLVDAKGQVVGVTAAIESPVRASSGVGFVIPSVIVNTVVPALIKDGKYVHSWLGLSAVTLTPDLAAANHLKADQRGVLISEVIAGGPADKAGLQGGNTQAIANGNSALAGGDVITSIDGQAVKQFEDVIIYLARSTQVGQTITLDILRSGKTEQVKVLLAARPNGDTQTGPVSDSSLNGSQLGISAATLTPEIAQAMRLPTDTQGVLIEQVQSGGVAEQAGLHGGTRSIQINGQTQVIGGDVIAAVDGQPVTQISELQQALANSTPGQPISLSVLRRGRLYDVSVTLGN